MRRTSARPLCGTQNVQRTRTNTPSDAQHSPKQKYPHDRSELPPAKPRGMRQKRAELKLKQRLKQSTEGDMILGDTILETRGLTKEIKGFTAVNDVKLRV